MQTMQENMQEVRALSLECEAIVARADGEGRELTREENMTYNAKSGRLVRLQSALREQVAEDNKPGTLMHALRGANGKPDFAKLLSGGAPAMDTPEKRIFGHDYRAAFYDYVGSNGQKLNAALYEGTGSAGGFIVPVVVEGQVVPLAPPDTGVRSIATVIPTAMDIKVPRATTISTSTGKAEGDGTGNNLFQESEPTLDQFTLSAFMAGVLHQISWELAQDVPSFQQFAVGDMLLAQSLYEENLFVNGTGTGQAQGIKGNVGTGTGVAVVAGTDNYASELLDATFDVMGTLKGAYHANASWLMARSTGVFLRKAQKQANLFAPVFTRVDGKDFLHGYPVTYSTSVDAVAAGKTPVYFGDFKQGYVIGDRGGAGINVKILDQPKALEGIIQLLAYRRTDGRVRRSEAVQSIAIHS